MIPHVEYLVYVKLLLNSTVYAACNTDKLYVCTCSAISILYIHMYVANRVKRVLTITQLW